MLPRFRAEIARALPLIASLLLVFVTYLWRLSTIVVADPQDEGTYLYAAKLINEGAVIHRDLMLAHPPVLVYLLAGIQRLVGDGVLACRVAYSALVVLSSAPLFVIGRRLGGSITAGALCLFAYTTGLIFIANEGRTIKLDPIMNAFLIAAAACLVLAPRRFGPRVLCGVFFAAALLVKLIAAIPIAMLAIGVLIAERRERGWFVRMLAIALGAALVLIPAGAWLLQQPRFLDDILFSQLGRAPFPFVARLANLMQVTVRYPVIALGIGAAAWMIVRPRDAASRTLALAALGTVVVMVAFVKVFMPAHIVTALPWIALCFGLTAVSVSERVPALRLQRLMPVAALLLGLLGGLYAEIYYRVATGHSETPARMLAVLARGQGEIYSMNPIFAMWSRRPLRAWYYQVDSYLARPKRVDDRTFMEVMSTAQALILFPGEFHEQPMTKDYVRRHFKVAIADQSNELWLRVQP